MSKSIIRTYSRHTSSAVILLGSLIRCARKEQKRTEQDVAERAGISRGLLQRIEKGGHRCEIGVVFEVASLLGVTLFDTKDMALSRDTRYVQEKLALLPKSIRKSQPKDNDDDF